MNWAAAARCTKQATVASARQQQAANHYKGFGRFKHGRAADDEQLSVDLTVREHHMFSSLLAIISIIFLKTTFNPAAPCVLVLVPACAPPKILLLHILARNSGWLQSKSFQG